MVEIAQPVPDSLEARLLAYRPLIERHVRALVRDRADAEELTQDTYARAFRCLDELRDPQAALAWLYRIATNVCLDRLRRREPAMVSLDAEVAVAEEVDDPARAGATRVRHAGRRRALGDVGVRAEVSRDATRRLSHRDLPSRRVRAQQSRDRRAARLLGRHRQDPAAQGPGAAAWSLEQSLHLRDRRTRSDGVRPGVVGHLPRRGVALLL